jgi:hypothetical protein
MTDRIRSRQGSRHRRQWFARRGQQTQTREHCAHRAASPASECDRGTWTATLPASSLLILADSDGILPGRRGAAPSAVGDVVAKPHARPPAPENITGCLPPEVELCGARRPRETAIISDINGIMKYGEIAKGCPVADDSLSRGRSPTTAARAPAQPRYSLRGATKAVRCPKWVIRRWRRSPMYAGLGLGEHSPAGSGQTRRAFQGGLQSRLFAQRSVTFGHQLSRAMPALIPATPICSATPVSRSPPGCRSRR